MVGVAFICCTFVAKIKCHLLNNNIETSVAIIRIGDSMIKPLESPLCVTKRGWGFCPTHAKLIGFCPRGFCLRMFCPEGILSTHPFYV